LEERERAAAEERKGRAGQPHSAKSAQQAGKGESRDKVAKAAGTGRTTLEKIAKVCEAPKRSPRNINRWLTRWIERAA
jgi:hypothetical protein